MDYYEHDRGAVIRARTERWAGLVVTESTIDDFLVLPRLLADQTDDYPNQHDSSRRIAHRRTVLLSNIMVSHTKLCHYTAR